MRDFAVTTHIKASPELVWSMLADIDSWPDWTPTVSSVYRVGNESLRVGSKVKLRQPKLKPAIWTVIDWRPNAGFTWVTRNPGFTIEADHVISQERDGTVVSLRIRINGLLSYIVAPLIRNLTIQYLHLEAAGLKHKAECAMELA